MDRKLDSVNIEQNSSRKAAWRAPTLEIRPVKDAANQNHQDNESYMGSYHENWHAH